MIRNKRSPEYLKTMQANINMLMDNFADKIKHVDNADDMLTIANFFGMLEPNEIVSHCRKALFAE